MSGVGGGSGGGGGSGNGGGGDEVAQELAEVKVEIKELKKVIEEQQRELKAAGWTFERIADNAQLAAKEQRLVELQKKENRLAEQQREQQTQAGECSLSVWCFVRAPMCSVRSRRRLLCDARGAVICVVRSDVWRRRWRHERVEMT